MDDYCKTCKFEHRLAEEPQCCICVDHDHYIPAAIPAKNIPKSAQTDDVFKSFLAELSALLDKYNFTGVHVLENNKIGFFWKKKTACFKHLGKREGDNKWVVISYRVVPHYENAEIERAEEVK